jgi:hypothetical protein
MTGLGSLSAGLFCFSWRRFSGMVLAVDRNASTPGDWYKTSQVYENCPGYKKYELPLFFKRDL